MQKTWIEFLFMVSAQLSLSYCEYLGEWTSRWRFCSVWLFLSASWTNKYFLNKEKLEGLVFLVMPKGCSQMWFQRQLTNRVTQPWIMKLCLKSYLTSLTCSRMCVQEHLPSPSCHQPLHTGILKKSVLAGWRDLHSFLLTKSEATAGCENITLVTLPTSMRSGLTGPE